MDKCRWRPRILGRNRRRHVDVGALGNRLGRGVSCGWCPASWPTGSSTVGSGDVIVTSGLTARPAWRRARGRPRRRPNRLRRRSRLGDIVRRNRKWFALPLPVLGGDVEVVGRHVHGVARRHDAGGSDRGAVAVGVDRRDPRDAETREVRRSGDVLAGENRRHRAEIAVAVLVERPWEPVLHAGLLDDLLVPGECRLLVEPELARLDERQPLVELVVMTKRATPSTERVATVEPSRCVRATASGRSGPPRRTATRWCPPKRTNSSWRPADGSRRGGVDAASSGSSGSATTVASATTRCAPHRSTRRRRVAVGLDHVALVDPDLLGVGAGEPVVEAAGVQRRTDVSSSARSATAMSRPLACTSPSAYM